MFSVEAQVENPYLPLYVLLQNIWLNSSPAFCIFQHEVIPVFIHSGYVCRTYTSSLDEDVFASDVFFFTYIYVFEYS